MRPELRRPGYIPPMEPEWIADIERIEKDVPYGTKSSAQTMDIYYPNGVSVGKYPVIAYFHGGGFCLGAKDDEDIEPMLRCLERGYVLASVNYRLADEAKFPAVIQDAKAAIRFLKANADRLGLDAKRIGVWGPSAGGWIVSMLGVTSGNPAFDDPDDRNLQFDSGVQAVVDWCGPCCRFDEMDLMSAASGQTVRRPHNSSNSPESKLLGGSPADMPELCRLIAPVTYVRPDMPPFLIVHGTADEAVPVEQSVRFCEAIRRTAGENRATLYLGEGMPHHGNPWYTETWLSDMCLDFFDRILKACGCADM